MNDLSTAIVPKSDQLNADDLIAGPRTITVSKVTVRSGVEQPVSLHYEGDNGKPYKPCKSMCRVLVMTWGTNGDKYVGRSMTLYRDEKVTWAGLEVGGIRISHMSHIQGAQTMALTATKSSKKPYTVLPMEARQKQEQAPTREPETKKPRGDLPTVLALLTDPVTAPSLLAGYLEKQAWTKPERAQLQAAVDALGKGKTTVDVGEEDVP